MTSSASAVREIYGELLRVAKRRSRSTSEAHDLVQDALEILLTHRGESELSSPAERAWLRGVIGKRAAFVARKEGRRRRRDEAFSGSFDPVEKRGGRRWTWEPRFLASLPRSLRQVATLASADLNAAEIRWLLGLRDPAFRQRLSALRKAVGAEAEVPTRPAPEPTFFLGQRRAHLLAALRRRPGAILATHDPDGHAILLCSVAHGTRPRGNSPAKEESCPDPT